MYFYSHLQTEMSIFRRGRVDTPLLDFRKDLFDSRNVRMFVMFTTTGVMTMS